MALRGHVFKKQLFSSECFALFIDTFLGSNSGIINGCELTSSVDNIHIAKGFFCIKGRFLEEEGGSDFVISAINEGESEKYCKLVCEIDLSKENTTSMLNQAYYRILEAENDFPELQKEDITKEGNIYQFEMAQFTVSTSGIENFQDKRMYLDFNSIYTEVRTQIENFFTDLDKEAQQEKANFFQDLNDWFQMLQEVLDENTATHLYNLINTKANKKKVYTIEIDTNWTEGSKTIQVEGIQGTDIVNISPIWSENKETRIAEKEEYNKISMVKSQENAIQIICDEETPQMALNVRLEVYY